MKPVEEGKALSPLAMSLVVCGVFLVVSPPFLVWLLVWFWKKEERTNGNSRNEAILAEGVLMPMVPVSGRDRVHIWGYVSGSDYAK